jgi:hypothetical protein
MLEDSPLTMLQHMRKKQGGRAGVSAHPSIETTALQLWRCIRILPASSPQMNPWDVEGVELWSCNEADNTSTVVAFKSVIQDFELCLGCLKELESQK